MECTKACPETADVAHPVERRAEEGATVFRSLCRQLLEHVDGVERLAQPGAPAALFPHAMTKRQSGQGGDEPERDGDDPRQREPEDTRPRLARIQTGCLERLPVDDKSPADHERTESGCDHRSRTPEPEPGTALQPRHLAVRDDVAEVRRKLHPERDRQPDRIEMTQLVEDPLEASGPGDARRSAEGQCRAEPDQQRMLGRLPVEMWLGPK